jgi:hypothetical protein
MSAFETEVPTPLVQSIKADDTDTASHATSAHIQESNPESSTASTIPAEADAVSGVSTSSLEFVEGMRWMVAGGLRLGHCFPTYGGAGDQYSIAALAYRHPALGGGPERPEVSATKGIRPTSCIPW